MSGLVHDVLTGHYYYLETAHDGFYGRMAYTDGVYVVNSREVYLTFNQEHDGSFGAILSGISELQNTGIETSDIAGIPTESESASTSTDNSVNNNGTSGNSETSDYDGYKSKADQIRNDQALKDAIREANPLDANYSHISLN